MADIDPRMVKWDGPIDPKMVKWDAPEEKAGFAADVVGGLVKGASNIGATILTPIDAAARAVGIQNSFIGRNDRRQASTAALESMGADPESLAFKGGELGAEVLGTAGVGGTLAKGVTTAARFVPQIANVAPRIATALQTGGMVPTGVASRAGDAALRVGGSLVSGGAMAGLSNPDDAAGGAAIGAALPAAIPAARLAGNAAAGVIGTMTGTGTDAVKNAFKAGRQGATEFLDNMRGRVGFDDVVAQAKQGLANMRKARGEQYRSGMVDIRADQSVLDMKPITKAVNDIQAMGSFKGQQINKNAAGTVDEIKKTVEEWAALNPAEYHTPEGLDALKQAIGDIRDVTQFGTPARKAADAVYNSIKKQIEVQAPTYTKVMKDYAQASETLAELERALSLGNKASIDTTVRKLQSLMRNNAQTSYGNRLNLANTLEQQGGVSLMPSIAGQAMNSWLPRGMVGAIEKAGIPGAAILGQPSALLAAPFTSPRLMGEAAYGLGRVLPQGALANPIPRAFGVLAQ